MTTASKYQVNPVTRIEGADYGHPKPIGSLLVEMGSLSRDSVDDIVRIQSEHQLLFGETAIKLGYVGKREVESALAQQFDYPYLEPGADSIGEQVIAAYDPFTPTVDSLRRLRTELLHRCFHHGVAESLAVVSAQRNEGRSFVVSNLAVLLAQSGKRTVVIDADMRHPQQHANFALDNRIGLSTVLLGCHLDDALQSVPAIPNLCVLTSGAIAPNPQELLSRPIFFTLLDDLSHQFDAILIDCPSANESADSTLLAMAARAALVVIRRDTSRMDDMKSVMVDLLDKDVKIVGAVMNNT